MRIRRYKHIEGFDDGTNYLEFVEKNGGYEAFLVKHNGKRTLSPSWRVEEAERYCKHGLWKKIFDSEPEDGIPYREMASEKNVGKVFTVSGAWKDLSFFVPFIGDGGVKVMFYGFNSYGEAIKSIWNQEKYKFFECPNKKLAIVDKS